MIADLWPIQQAVYAALSASPATYPTYDAVPQNTAYPYLTIGVPDELPDEEISAPGSDIALDIDAWSRQAGKREAYAMLRFVKERLDGQSIGAGVWSCTVESRRVIEDPSSTASSRLYHGIAGIRIRAN